LDEAGGGKHGGVSLHPAGGGSGFCHDVVATDGLWMLRRLSMYCPARSG
jgi:hypothetical protein